MGPTSLFCFLSSFSSSLLASLLASSSVGGALSIRRDGRPPHMKKRRHEQSNLNALLLSSIIILPSLPRSSFFIRALLFSKNPKSRPRRTAFVSDESASPTPLPPCLDALVSAVPKRPRRRLDTAGSATPERPLRPICCGREGWSGRD